jgi:hypothetical protein
MKKIALSLHNFLLDFWKNKTKPETKFQDRRVFQRIPAELALRFLDSHSKEWGLVRTQDISEKGIGILSEKKLLPPTSLEMWLLVPRKGESLYARGKVIWSKRARRNKYRAGISLDEMDLTEILRAFGGNKG